VLVPIAASVAVALALAVTAAVLSGSDRSDTPASGSGTGTRTATTREAAAPVVPWRPLKPSPPATHHRATHAAAPACSRGALAVTIAFPGGAGGTLYLRVTVKNHSPSACTLRDSDLKIHWRAHEHITVYHGKTRTLTPGKALAYQLGFSESCVALNSSTSITYKPATGSVAGAAVTTRGKGVPATVKCTDATLEAIT
jgi:hypothetical protein